MGFAKWTWILCGLKDWKDEFETQKINHNKNWVSIEKLNFRI